MTDHQGGILPASGRHRRFLEYVFRAAADTAALKTAIVQALQPVHGEVEIVVGFGPTAYERLAGAVPAGLKPFDAIGPAPASQRDLWLFVHGDGHDQVLEQAIAGQRALAGLADLALEVAGFTYRENRDLIGFVDGTANPKEDAARDAAFIAPGQPFAAGSFVLSQKWVHDLPAFQALSVGEQEQVVGRTKADDIELEGAAMPATSHVSRTDAKLDGTAAKILRRSSPYGGAGEHGLYFVAFACDLERHEFLLRRMYGVTEDGIQDRLTAYTKPVTGAYWFAPSRADLAALLAV